jgi:hypothetical protein
VAASVGSSYDLGEIYSILEHPESSQSMRSLKDSVPTDSQVASPNFRQKFLFTIMSYYFPKNKVIFDDYFDVEVRNEWKRKELHKKQKRLKKFFGATMTEIQMKKQVVDNSSYIEESRKEESPSFGSEMGPSEEEENIGKRRKSEKLANFFGNNITTFLLNSQKICSASGESLAAQQDDVKQDNSFIGALNELLPEEKMVLTKRAKKLLLVLGDGAEGYGLAKGLNNIRRKESKNEDEIRDFEGISLLKSDGDSDAYENDSSDNDKGCLKNSKKSRANKLWHLLGERILPGQLVQDNSTAVPRPLSAKEKQVYRKKVEKLERMLGASVPAKSIVAYDNIVESSDEDSDHTETISVHSKDPEEVQRQLKISKLKKIQKIMGIKGPVNGAFDDHYLQDLERSVGVLPSNAETREVLKTEIQKIRLSNAIRPQAHQNE